MNDNNMYVENDFIKAALYDKFKKDFAEEAREAFLNQKELWIGDIGYIKSEIKNQGTKSGEVIKNVKLKIYPSKKFKREVNQAILGK